VLRSFLHVRAALSGLGAVLVVFRVLLPHRLPADGVPHGVHLADDISGGAEVRVCLLSSGLEVPSEVVFDARHRGCRRRRLHDGRRVAGLPAGRANIQRRTSPVADTVPPRRRRRQRYGACRSHSLPVLPSSVRRAPRDDLLQLLLLVASNSHPRDPVFRARPPEHRAHPHHARGGPPSTPDVRVDV